MLKKCIVWKWGMDMYKTLWNYLNENHMKSAHRPAAFLALLTVGWSVIGVLAGLLVCLGFQKELMIKLTVILCTGGYAGLILGFFGGWICGDVLLSILLMKKKFLWIIQFILQIVKKLSDGISGSFL